MTGQSVKGKVLEDKLKMTLLARIIPNLPVDDTRKWVKDTVKKFEFGHYFKEYGKLVREEWLKKYNSMMIERSNEIAKVREECEKEIDKISIKYDGLVQKLSRTHNEVEKYHFKDPMMDCIFMHYEDWLKIIGKEK